MDRVDSTSVVMRQHAARKQRTSLTINQVVDRDFPASELSPNMWVVMYDCSVLEMLLSIKSILERNAHPSLLLHSTLYKIVAYWSANLAQFATIWRGGAPLQAAHKQYLDSFNAGSFFNSIPFTDRRTDAERMLQFFLEMDNDLRDIERDMDAADKASECAVDACPIEQQL